MTRTEGDRQLSMPLENSDLWP